MRRMRGVYMVEFAIVSSVLMITLFACIELGRTTYTLAALNEGTRRAARLAAVCPLNDPAIASAVNFMGVYGFNTATNVKITYLDANGNALAGTPPLSSVYYVKVNVTGYTIALAIPVLNLTITVPPYAVTLPAESLGLSGAGVSTAC